MSIDNSESNFYINLNSEACDTQFWTNHIIGNKVGFFCVFLKRVFEAHAIK